MVRTARFAMLGCVLALLGCAEEQIIGRTQLMLVADTDIATLDGIEFEVRQEDAGQRSGKTSVDLSDAPFTIAVLRERGSLGPLQVSASGYRGNTLLVTRSAEVWFVPQKTLTVVLHLAQSCLGMACGAGKTCTETGCDFIASDAGLPSWNGTPPRLGDVDDAGTLLADAGDAGTRSDAAADASWAQCSGSTVDLNSDLDHCGKCNKPCRTTTGANTVAACLAGTCGTACRALWGDCDGNATNGCENSLVLDMENCGACGMTCASGQYCWAGSCRSSAGQN